MKQLSFLLLALLALACNSPQQQTSTSAPTESALGVTHSPSPAPAPPSSSNLAKPQFTSTTGNVILTQGYCNYPVYGLFLVGKNIMPDTGKWTIQFSSDTIPNSNFVMNFNTDIDTLGGKYMLVAVAFDNKKLATKAETIHLNTVQNPIGQIPLDAQDLANHWGAQYNLYSASFQANNIYRNNTYKWSAFMNANPSLIIDQGTIALQ